MIPMQITLSMMFVLGFLGLTLQRKHLLSALLCLESMMLAIYITMALWSFNSGSSMFSLGPMVLLTFSACEASAGLALLVATSRTHGADLLKNLNLLQC
nr:NADH dehydrogenase subunit 4L [Kaupichthys diodontus]